MRFALTIVSMALLLAGCGDKVEPKLDIKLPTPEEETDAKTERVYEMIVLASGFKYDGKEVADIETLKAVLQRDQKELLEKGCVITVSPDAPEQQLTATLGALTELGVTKLSVLTLKSDQPEKEKGTTGADSE